MDIASKKS